MINRGLIITSKLYWFISNFSKAKEQQRADAELYPSAGKENALSLAAA